MSRGLSNSGAADRQHLLLAARQLAPELRFALLEPREQLEHPLDRPGAGPGERHPQIFQDGQVAKNLAPFGHIADAERGDPVRWPSRRVGAENFDLAVARRGQPDQAAHRRRLARAVAPEEGDDLALADLDRHTLEDVALAVIGVNVRGDEDRLHCASPR